MTRKQAFLVLLIALLILAGHQHIQWPSRFWESPSFRALNWDDIAKRFSAEEPTAEEPVTEAMIETEPTPPPKELKPSERKPEEKPPRKETKKPPKKAATSAVEKKPPADQPATTAVSDPAPATKQKIAFASFPEGVKSRIRTCWAHAQEIYDQQGSLQVQYTYDKEGYLHGIRIMDNSLGIPLVTRCVTEMLDAIQFERFDPTKVGVALYETTIIFKRGKEPS